MERASSPEITVMMPTFNTVEYIDSAILSVLAQEGTNWRMLAYDDHSDDGTHERLQFWANQDPRITVGRPFDDHGHYTDICNQLLEDAQSLYVARMDSDDISLPHRLKTQLEFMQGRDTATLIGGMGLNIIEAEGGRISDEYPWESEIIKPVASYEETVNDAIRTHHRIIHGTLFGRKDDLVEIGGYQDLFPIEDWELTLRVAEEGGAVYVIPEIVYLRRVHSHNASKGHPNKQAAFQYIVDRYNLNLEELPRSRPAHL